jgi:hypothetical protein
MTKNEYAEYLADSLVDIMAATLIDSSNQGDNLEVAAARFARKILDDWLWQEIDQDASKAASRAADYSYGGTHRHPLDMD